MSNPPGQPGWGQPPYGEPGAGQPDYSQPGTPNAEPPAYGSPYPSYDQPGSGPPAYGQEYGQSPYGQPDPYGTPQYSAPPDYQQQYSAPPDPGYAQTQAIPAYADPGQPYADPGQPGGPAYPGYPGYGPAAPPPKKSNTGLIVGVVIGVVVLLLCVGGGIGVFALSRNPDIATSGTPTATSAPSGDSTPSDGPTTDGDKLASRTTDSTPLSLSEFSESSYSVPSGTFQRTGQDESATCSLAVNGTAKSLVRTLDCSQAASVTAVNSAGCVVTFGALNFPDEEAAATAFTKIAGGDSGGFVPRAHGDAREGKAGTSDFWFFRQTLGHWLIFATGAYADGRPSANDSRITACDKDFINLMETKLDNRR